MVQSLSEDSTPPSLSVGTERVTHWLPPALDDGEHCLRFASSPWFLIVCISSWFSCWFSLQQLLPGDGFGEDLPLQPEVVIHLEVLGQVDPLPQDALQAVVHRQEVWVAVGLVVAATVEALDVRPQSALLGLEVPGPSIQICQFIQTEFRKILTQRKKFVIFEVNLHDHMLSGKYS